MREPDVNCPACGKTVYTYRTAMPRETSGEVMRMFTGPLHFVKHGCKNDHKKVAGDLPKWGAKDE